MKTTPVLNILFLQPLRVILLVGLLVMSGKGYGQIITTVAGGGSGGDGGPATAASIYDPVGIAFDKAGNLYISEQLTHDIRKIDVAGIITTFAGNTSHGFSGDGGAATSAMLNQPCGITFDRHENLFIADAENHRIRKVNGATGIITTICGNGTAGYSGDGGAATAAVLNTPIGVLFDKAGNLYISSATGYIRKIDTIGRITAFAGTGSYGISGDGGPATLAQIYAGPMCFDNSGNLLFCDPISGLIRKVNASGIISHVAGVVDSFAYNGDGIPAINSHILPNGIAAGSDGVIYVGDYWNKRLRTIDKNGIIHTISGNGIEATTGDGGLADTAELDNPAALAFDSCGNLYFTQIDNPRVRKVTYPYCGYLSVEESKSCTSDLRFYPNPVGDVLFIEGDVPLASVVLTDFLGQVVYRQAGVRGGTLQVSMGNLPCGIYVLEVMNSVGVKEVKRVVRE